MKEAQILVRIPEDLRRRLRVRLAFEGKTLKDDIMDHIETSCAAFEKQHIR
jgi:plasmid stability protein